MDAKDKNKSKQIKIEIDDSVGQGEYVNFAIVTHSIAEFIIDFVRILPGIPKSKVKSRIVISPIHAKTFMKALEAGDSSAQAASVTKKKALRDAPAAKAITDADTIAKLKAAWDTSVLGDSPYA